MPPPFSRLKLAWVFLMLVSRAVAAEPPAESPLTVFILAGQSEMLDWHADASLVPHDDRDAAIRFYYHTGAPPLHPQFPRNLFNATSHDIWTTLGAQTQEPYHKFVRTFFGPEMSLGRRLAKDGVRPLAIIKIGYFGTNLADDWRPDAKTGNQLYALMGRQVIHALDLLKAQGRPFQLAGIFWMQGGSDGANQAYAAAYEKNLSAFIDRMRADFGAADAPFVLSRISPPRTEKLATEREQIRAAQVTVGSTKAHCAWIDADDISYAEDGVHPDAHGALALGERLATTWLKLQAVRPSAK